MFLFVCCECVLFPRAGAGGRFDSPTAVGFGVCIAHVTQHPLAKLMVKVALAAGPTSSSFDRRSSGFILWVKGGCQTS